MRHDSMVEGLDLAEAGTAAFLVIWADAIGLFTGIVQRSSDIFKQGDYP